MSEARSDLHYPGVPARGQGSSHRVGGPPEHLRAPVRGAQSGGGDEYIRDKSQPGEPIAISKIDEAALREKAKREAAIVSTRTHAADDDSASIDDENIENSQTIGLAAVLEILGGRVIEEKMTEGGY